MPGDELNPGTTPGQIDPSPAPYKDRSGGLIAFGILTICVGCVCGLFVPLMLFGLALSKNAGVPPAPLSGILPGLLLYAVLAVALIWVGIGSIIARRWARALLLIFSWSWLVVGLLAMVFMGFMVPQMLQGMTENSTPERPPLPSGAVGMVMFLSFLVLGFVFILLPAAWVFFYRSPHVKATCEARDPVTRWTDACPLPVLGLSLWLAISVPMILMMPLVGHGVLPFFGAFLHGLPGDLLAIVIAAIWGYAAWSLYHLDKRGWWLIFVALILFSASSLITFARHDMTEMYRLMDYPQAHIDQIEKTGLLKGNTMVWLMFGWMLPFFGYLLYVKRFLRR